MTQLNTTDFRNAFNALNRAKFPRTHDDSRAYIALAVLLESGINNKFGITQIQKLLIDPMTENYKKELSEL